MNARAQGLTVRMLVAVTEHAIHVLAMPSIGKDPGRELMHFDRQTTEAGIKKFGLSRHLKLEDSASGRHIGLTGSMARFSAGSKGDKAVLAELAESGS